MIEGLPVYALNMSAQDIEPTDAFAEEIGEYLVAFAARLPHEALLRISSDFRQQSRRRQRFRNETTISAAAA